MPQQRTITSVESMVTDWGEKREDVWLIHMDVEGGLPWAYALPHSTLSWRSAEYGIDPGDVETLLDIVLHEHHFTLDHADPTFLYNADEATARAAHLQRVQEAKTRVTHHDPGNLLEKIRNAYDPADPQTAVRAAQVRSARARSMKGKANG